MIENIVKRGFGNRIEGHFVCLKCNFWEEFHPHENMSAVAFGRENSHPHEKENVEPN